MSLKIASFDVMIRSKFATFNCELNFGMRGIQSAEKTTDIRLLTIPNTKNIIDVSGPEPDVLMTQSLLAEYEPVTRLFDLIL